MDRRLIFFDVINRLRESLILEKSSIFDGPGNPDQILFHHPAGADIEVSGLGIALLRRKQPDIATVGFEDGRRIALQAAKNMGRGLGSDGVARILGRG